MEQPRAPPLDLGSEQSVLPWGELNERPGRFRTAVRNCFLEDY